MVRFFVIIIRNVVLFIVLVGLMRLAPFLVMKKKGAGFIVFMRPCFVLW